MNSINSLYFPGTQIYSINQYPLFLLFSKMHLLGIAESNIHGKGEQATDSFINEGLYQLHIPCPLADDLDRFIHLFSDIKNRTDDYASQLSALTLAAMSAPDQSIGDSKQEIISSILTTTMPGSDKKESEMDSQLWQARLVLAIAELLDHEEEDIALQLAILQDNEAELFSELQGESDDDDQDSPLAELALIKDNLNQPNPGNVQKRLRSWRQLYKEGDFTGCELLLTTSKDAAELLFESFENNKGKPALGLGKLALPATIGLEQETALNNIRSFHSSNTELITEISARLQQLQTSDCKTENDQSNSMSDLAKPWEQCLETMFPAAQFGRIPLSFYSFAEISGSELLGVNHQAKDSNCLLAVADISNRD